jgi:hypothetical protein
MAFLLCSSATSRLYACQAFLAAERPDITGTNMSFKVVTLDNGTDPQGPGLAGFVDHIVSAADPLII